MAEGVNIDETDAGKGEEKEQKDIRCCPCPWNSKCTKCVCVEAGGCRPSCNSRRCSYKNVAGENQSIPDTAKETELSETTAEGTEITATDNEKNVGEDVDALKTVPASSVLSQDIVPSTETDESQPTNPDELKPEDGTVKTEDEEESQPSVKEEPGENLEAEEVPSEQKDSVQGKDALEKKAEPEAENAKIEVKMETNTDAMMEEKNEISIKTERDTTLKTDTDPPMETDTDLAVKIETKAGVKTDTETAVKTENDTATEAAAGEITTPEAVKSSGAKQPKKEVKSPAKSAVGKKKAVKRTTDKEKKKTTTKKTTQIRKRSGSPKKEDSATATKRERRSSQDESKKTEESPGDTKEESPAEETSSEPYMPGPLDFIDDVANDMILRTLRIGPLVLQDLENEELFGCLQRSKQFTLNIFNTVLSDAKDGCVADAADEGDGEGHDEAKTQAEEKLAAAAKSDGSEPTKCSHEESLEVDSSENPEAAASEIKEESQAPTEVVEEKSGDQDAAKVSSEAESKSSQDAQIEVVLETDEKKDAIEEETKADETSTDASEARQKGIETIESKETTVEPMETDSAATKLDDQAEAPAGEQSSSNQITGSDAKTDHETPGGEESDPKAGEQTGESSVTSESKPTQKEDQKDTGQSSEKQTKPASTKSLSKSNRDMSQCCCIAIRNLPDSIVTAAKTKDESGADVDPNKGTSKLKASELVLHRAVCEAFKSYGKTVKIGVFDVETPSPYAVVKYIKPEAAAQALQDARSGKHWDQKLDAEYHTNPDAMMPVPFEPSMNEYHKHASRVLQVHFSGMFEGSGKVDATTAKLKSIFRQYGSIQHVSIRLGWMRLIMDAYIKYADITSVITALKTVDKQVIGYDGVQIGFGKALPCRILWIGGLNESATEEELHEVFSLYGDIEYCHVDSTQGYALICFKSEDSAKSALSSLRGERIAGQKIQIDYSHMYCENQFFRHMVRTGQLTAEDVPKWVPIPSSCVYGSLLPKVAESSKVPEKKETVEEVKELLDEYCRDASRVLYIGEFEKDETIDVHEFEKLCLPYGYILFPAHIRELRTDEIATWMRIAVPVKEAIDIKKQSFADCSFVLVEYNDISSVVRAMQEMDKEILGKTRKLMFARSPTTRCVWLGNVDEFITEEEIKKVFGRYESVTRIEIDRTLEEALIFFDTRSKTKALVSQWRRLWIRKRVQVDFASKRCQENFLERKKNPMWLWNHPAWINNDDDTVYSYIDVEFFTPEDFQQCLQTLDSCHIGVRPIVAPNIDPYLGEKIALNYELDQMSTFEKKTLTDIGASNIVSIPGIPIDDITEEDLKAKVSNIESVFIPRTTEGISKGYAYVEVSDGKLREMIGKRVDLGKDMPLFRLTELGDRPPRSRSTSGHSTHARSSLRHSSRSVSTHSHPRQVVRKKSVHERLGVKPVDIKARTLATPRTLPSTARGRVAMSSGPHRTAPIRRPPLLGTAPARAAPFNRPTPLMNANPVPPPRSQALRDRMMMAEKRKSTVALAIRRQQEAQRRAEEQVRRERELAYNYALIQREEEERQRIIELRRERHLQHQAYAYNVRDPPTFVDRRDYPARGPAYEDVEMRRDREQWQGQAVPPSYRGYEGHDARYDDAAMAQDSWHHSAHARYEQAHPEAYAQRNHYPPDDRIPTQEHPAASYPPPPAREAEHMDYHAKSNEYKSVAYDNWHKNYQSDPKDVKSDPASFEYGAPERGSHDDNRAAWSARQVHSQEYARAADTARMPAHSQHSAHDRMRDQAGVDKMHRQPAIERDWMTKDQTQRERSVGDPSPRYKHDGGTRQSRGLTDPSPRRDRREPSPQPLKRTREPSPRHVKKGRDPSPRRQKVRDPSPRRDRGRDPSPRYDRGRNVSPKRDRGRDPSPRRDKRQDPSPRSVRRQDPSPRRDRAREPSPRRDRRVADPSPRKVRDPSPRRDRRVKEPSPLHHRRGRSPSPRPARRAKEPSPRHDRRDRSVSPRRVKKARDVSPRRVKPASPRRARSPSPKRARSPAYRRSPSPRKTKTYRDRSPVRRRSPSPKRGKSARSPRQDKSPRHGRRDASPRERRRSRSRSHGRRRSTERRSRDKGGSQVDPVAAVNLLLGLSSLISSQNDSSSSGSYSHR